MAGDARAVAALGDAQQDHIVVAIEADFMDRLHMARFFAFEPQFVARAAEIHGAPEFCSFLQRFAVHPGKHQHIAATLLLGNHGHQAFFVPVHGVQPSGR